MEGECQGKEAIDDSEKKRRVAEWKCALQRYRERRWGSACVLMFLNRSPNGQSPSVLWAQTVTLKVPLRDRLAHTGSRSHVAHTHEASRRLHLCLLICQIPLHLHSISRTFNRFTHNFYSYGSGHKMARSLENNPAIFHISLWCLAKSSHLLKGFGVVFVCVFRISLPHMRASAFLRMCECFDHNGCAVVVKFSDCSWIIYCCERRCLN